MAGYTSLVSVDGGFCNGVNWVRDHGGGARGIATASGDAEPEPTLELGIVSDGQIWPLFAVWGRSYHMRSSLPAAREGVDD